VVISLSLADAATSVHNVSHGDRCHAADGNRELLTVIAFMRATRGQREELKTASGALIEPTKRQDRYVNYDAIARVHAGNYGV
jgi:hypothetical protein